MSIKYAGQTVVGPGNEIYVGENGNFFCGLRDLGIKAKSDVSIISKSDFQNQSDTGLYYVVYTPTDSAEPTIELWYIDSIGNKKPVIGNKYIIPTVGENGNWFINGTDTGFPSIIRREEIKLNIYRENWTPLGGTNLFSQNVTCQGLKAGDSVTYRLDINQDNISSLVKYKEEFDSIIHFIVHDGYVTFIATKELSVTIPIVVSRLDSSEFGKLKGGADIDDNSVNLTTVWSSMKVNNTMNDFQNEVKAMAIGKNLEFNWLGSQLGVRQEGYSSYRYRDLKGPAGLCGIDGSSIVDATIDDSGNLLLTIQDDEVEIDTTKMLTLESGVFTANDLLSIRNSINRINNDLASLKTGPVSQVYKVKEFSTEYKHVLSLSGAGTIQFFTTKFTGKVRITVDGTVYEGSFDSLVNQSDNNLLVPSYTDNGIVMNSMFASDQTTPLNFTFELGVSLEIMATTNQYNYLPTILIQGDYYWNGEYGEESSEPIEFGSVSDTEINNIFDELFPEYADNGGDVDGTN